MVKGMYSMEELNAAVSQGEEGDQVKLQETVTIWTYDYSIEAKANGRGAENVSEGAGYVYRLAAFEARGMIQ